MARARAALGDIEGARAALAELAGVAESVESELLRAALPLANGIVEAAAGAPGLARGLLEDAVDRYERGRLRSKPAEARAALAEVLRGLGQRQAAERETHQVVQAFERLGAPAAARRAHRSPALTPRRR